MTELTAAQDHEGRISRLEGIVEQINQRLDSLDRGQAALRTELNTLRSEFNSLRSEFNTGFRWLVGIQLTSLLALGALIMSKLPG